MGPKNEEKFAGSELPVLSAETFRQGRGWDAISRGERAQASHDNAIIMGAVLGLGQSQEECLGGCHMDASNKALSDMGSDLVLTCGKLADEMVDQPCRYYPHILTENAFIFFLSKNPKWRQ
jgi:hypothetical protein